MMTRVGLRWRRTLILRSEARGQPIATAVARILGKELVENLQRRDRKLINHETDRITHSLLRETASALPQTLRSADCFRAPGTTITCTRLIPPR